MHIPAGMIIRLPLLFTLCALLSIVSPARGADNREQLAKQLFDPQQLLDIRIEMPEEKWKALAAQRRDFASSFLKTVPESPYTWFRADLTINGVRIPSVGIRKKGFFGSMDERRPSLKVKFREYKKNERLGRVDRLTLNNNKQDRAHISQILSYRAFRKAGLPAPRCNLAIVRVNGRSLGVYGNVESIKKPFLQRTFGNSSGVMFEGVFPTDFFADRLERFELKAGKKKKAARAYEELREICKILEKPGPDLLQRLNKHFDMDEFIKHWATEVMIGFWDGYAGNQNNYYLYKNPKDNRFHWIPWGADFALSNQFQFGPKSIKAKGLITYHLYQIPEVREKYVAQLKQLLKTVWNEAEMLAEVKRVAALVRPHLHEDQQRGFDQAVEGSSNFISNRRSEILKELDSGPVAVTNPPGKPMYYKLVGQVSGKFKTVWVAESQPNAPARGEVKLELTVDGKPVRLAKQSVSAAPGRFRGFGPRRGPAGPPPPTLTFSLEPQAEGATPYRLSIGLQGPQFTRTDKPLAVRGFLMQGRGFGPGMRMFMGQLSLTAAEQKPDAPVEGTLTGKLYQMRGTFGGPRGGGRRGGARRGGRPGAGRGTEGRRPQGRRPERPGSGR